MNIEEKIITYQNILQGPFHRSPSAHPFIYETHSAGFELWANDSLVEVAAFIYHCTRLVHRTHEISVAHFASLVLTRLFVCLWGEGGETDRDRQTDG